MPDTTCDYAGCERDATLTRRYKKTGTTYDYCSDHDPLDDPEAADFWGEV